jgi:hypothetical protein
VILGWCLSPAKIFSKLAADSTGGRIVLNSSGHVVKNAPALIILNSSTKENIANQVPVPKQVDKNHADFAFDHS